MSKLVRLTVLFFSVLLLFSSTVFASIPEVLPEVSINGVNQTYVEGTPIVLLENETYSLQFFSTNPNNQPLYFDERSSSPISSSGSPSFLFLLNQQGQATYNDVDNANRESPIIGIHTLNVDVSDDPPGAPQFFHRREFTFNLTPVNYPPEFVQSTLNISCEEGSECSGQVIALDRETDFNDLVFSFGSVPGLFLDTDANGNFNFTPTFTQANQGEFLVPVNVSDGENVVSDILNITLTTENIRPIVNWSTDPAFQNQTENFIWEINATNDLEETDFYEFTIASSCSPNPWSIQNISNGLGGEFAVGRINISLNNDNNFVVCRDVTVFIHEYDNTTMNLRRIYEYNITLPIINTNDPPEIHEINTLNLFQPNMSEQFAATGLSFSYFVNATDPDFLTYEAENESLTFSLFSPPTFPSSSEPMFAIDSETGEVFSTQSQMNESYIGVWNITVQVTDNLTPQFTVARNLTLNVSLNQPPVLHPFDSSDCFDNFRCSKNISAFDPEGDVLFLFLNLTYTNPFQQVDNSFSQQDIFSLFNISPTPVISEPNVTFIMNWTPTDSNIGNYSLRVTFQDVVGNTNSSYLNFSVFNTPDAPFLSNRSDEIVPIDFPWLAETIPFQKDIFMFDDDLLWGNDNLTLNYSFIGDSLSSFSLEQVNDTFATINFTPQIGEDGTYTINFTVVDSFGLSDTQIVNFTVYDLSYFPNITEISPWFNEPLNNTIFSSFLTLPDSSVRVMDVFTPENTTRFFDIVADDRLNSNLTVSWFIDGQLINTSEYGSHAYERYFSFFDTGVYNFTVRVDGIGFDEFTWIVDVENVNRPPLFINPLRNFTGASGSLVGSRVAISRFFSLNQEATKVFYDPDDDPNENGQIDYHLDEINSLNFTLGNDACDEYAVFNFANGTDDVAIDILESGTCTTFFIATDPYGEYVYSNNASFQFVKVESSSGDAQQTSGSRTRTVVETVTIPIDIPVEDPELLKIIFPGLTETYVDERMVTPIIIRNTWNEPLTGINLGMDDGGLNLTYEFSQGNIPSLGVNQEVELNLTIFGYRRNEPFSFNISAFIGSLQYTDIETIYISSLERGSEDLESIRSRISFARDLLADTPECAELVSVIREMESNPNAVTLEVVNNIINACRYLMSSELDRSTPLPKSFVGRLSLYSKAVVDFNLLAIIVASLLFLSLIAGLLIKSTMKTI